MEIRKSLERAFKLLGIGENTSEFSDEELAKILAEKVEKLVDELESYKQQLEASAILLDSHVEELTRAYEELASIFEIFQISTRVDVNPRDLIVKLLETANNSIEAEFAGFVERSHEFRVFLNARTPEDIAALAYEYLKGEPHVVIRENVRIKATFVNTLMMVPVVGSKGFWGVIIFACKKRAPIFTSSDRKLVEALAQRLASLYDTQAYVEELLAQERLLEEMRIAKRIQHSLIPKEFPKLEYARIAHLFETARMVGGDFFDVWNPPKMSLFFAVADVSGKGVPAAIMMSLFKGALRTKLSDVTKLGELISYLNRIAVENMPPEMFVTLLGAFLTPSGQLAVGNAGHNPLLVVRENRVEHIQASAPPLRVLEDTSVEEVKLKLKTGDLIVSFTDGITEARNEKKEEYGMDRLEYMLKKHFHLEEREIVKKIKLDLAQFVGNAPRHDDATLLLIRYTGR